MDIKYQCKFGNKFIVGKLFVARIGDNKKSTNEKLADRKLCNKSQAYTVFPQNCTDILKYTDIDLYSYTIL